MTDQGAGEGGSGRLLIDVLALKETKKRLYSLGGTLYACTL